MLIYEANRSERIIERLISDNTMSLYTINSALILRNGDIVELKNHMDGKKNETEFKKIHLGHPFFACCLGGYEEKNVEEKPAKIRINFRE